ncbi:universal stress protein [Streptomyces sp. NPDC054833]
MSGYDASATARVVVGVSGSLGSITALRWAATEAGRRDAELWPVLAWVPPGGELAARRSPSSALLVDEWQRLAGQRLVSVLDEVFGDAGPGLPTRALVIRGTPGPALVETASREDDVLVVGAGRRGHRPRAFSGWVSRYCLTHATCPVIAFPPSPLEPQLAAVHRRNTWRLRLDSRRVLEEETVPPGT